MGNAKTSGWQTTARRLHSAPEESEVHIVWRRKEKIITLGVFSTLQAWFYSLVELKSSDRRSYNIAHCADIFSFLRNTMACLQKIY